MSKSLNSLFARARLAGGKWYKEILPPLFVLRHVKVVSKGYQTYFYTKHDVIPGDAYMRLKTDLLEKTMRYVLPGKTVLDLGCAEGYFSILAKQMGARDVLGVDMNQKCCEVAGQVARYKNLDNIKFQNASIFDLSSEVTYDVLLILALVHWFPSEKDRPQYDSYEPIIEWLSMRGRQLIIEFISEDDHTLQQPWWADPSDPAFADKIKNNFTREKFLAALRKRYKYVECLGKTSQTRELYYSY